MKKTNAWMIAIICFMMLFLLSGIANAQELLIQPQQAEPQQIVPTETTPVESDRVPTFEFLGMYYTNSMLNLMGMVDIGGNV